MEPPPRVSLCESRQWRRRCHVAAARGRSGRRDGAHAAASFARALLLSYDAPVLHACQPSSTAWRAAACRAHSHHDLSRVRTFSSTAPLVTHIASPALRLCTPPVGAAARLVATRCTSRRRLQPRATRGRVRFTRRLRAQPLCVRTADNGAAGGAARHARHGLCCTACRAGQVRVGAPLQVGGHAAAAQQQ